MGVNRAGFGIIDDRRIQEAAHQEIIRRYFRCGNEYVMGFVDKEILELSERIMQKVDGNIFDRAVVKPARDAAEEARECGKGNDGIYCGAAIELKDGIIITGKNSQLLHAGSSLVLNACKHLAGIPDKLHLIPENVIASLKILKKDVLQGKMISLDLEETLIALAISANSNPAAEMAVKSLKELRGCEVHMTHIPTPGDEAGLRKLGVNPTSDPKFSSKNLFIT